MQTKNSTKNSTKPDSKPFPRLVTAIALVLTLLVAFGVMSRCAPVAHSAEIGPVKDGWHWILPDGTVVGSPAPEGYRDVCSVVPEHESRLYWGAYGPENGWHGMVYDRSWTRINELREQFYKGEARQWGVQGLDTLPELVVPCSAIPAGSLVEVDHVREDLTIEPGLPNHGKDDDLTPVITPTPIPEPTTPPVVVAPKPEPEPTTPPVVTTPAPAPAPTPTTPPVVTTPKPAPKPVVVTRLVQVDAYLARTPADRRRISGYQRDRLLHRGEDWMGDLRTSTWKIQRETLVNGRVTKTVVLRSGGNGARLKGPRVVVRWELAKGATVAKPFGARNNLPQKLIR